MSALALTMTVASTGLVAIAPSASAAAAAPTITSVPTSPGTSTSPQWTFSLVDPLATPECSLVATPAPPAWGGCTSATSYTASLSQDGDYTFSVREQSVTQDGTEAGSTYTLDTRAGLTFTSTPPSPSSSLTPSWAMSIDGTATCTFGGTVAPCSTSFQGTLDSGSADGPYDLVVAVTDSLGNTNSYVSQYVLDRTGPVFTVSGPTGSGTQAPTWTWPTSAGDVSTCTLVGPDPQGPSTCTSGYTPTLTLDGTYHLDVTVRDAVGNAATQSSSDYTYTGAAPAAPVFTALPPAGKDTTPSWSFTATGATTTCSLVGAAAGTFDSGPCTSSYTAPTLASDSWTLTVKTSDALGNNSSATSPAYVLDLTTAPSAPVVTTPNSPSQDSDPIWTWTSESGTTSECQGTFNGTRTASWVACTSGLPVSLTQGEGTYELIVRVNAAGLSSTETVSAPYVYDRSAPGAPTVSAPASPSNNARPQFTFTGEAGTASCRVLRAGTEVRAYSTCSSPFTVDLSAQPDSAYDLEVTITDAALNVGTPGQTATAYVLDRTAPSAPLVSGPSTSIVSSLTFSWTGESGTTAQCTLVKDGSPLGTAACASPYTPTLAGDGTYVLQVTLTDAALNTGAPGSSTSYVVDTHVPVAPIVTGPASPGNALLPVWNATGEAGATFECELSPAVTSTLATWAACVFPLQVDLTGQPDGDYVLSVRAVSAAGTPGPAQSATYTLDTAAPTVVVITGPASPGSNAVPVWGIVGDSDAELQCQLDGPGFVAPTFSPCAGQAGQLGTGSFTADLTSSPDGTYTLTAHSRDAAGNDGPDVTSSYVLDREAPATPVGLAAPTSPSAQPVISWTFQIEPGDTAVCTLRSATTVIAPRTACSSPWTTDLTSLPDGDYALTVRAVDAADNLSTGAVGHYVLDRTVPDPPTIAASPGSPSPDRDPVWGLQAADPRDRLECRLIGLPGSTWEPCPSPTTYDLGTATKGTYQLEVREIDAAGNASSVVTSEPYVLDLTAPPVPQVLPPSPQAGNKTSAVFTVVRAALDTETAQLRCTATRFDGGTAVVTPCAFGPVTVTFAGLHGDGPVVLTVRGVDALGNESAASSATFRFDDIRPAAARVLGPVERTSFDPVATWTFAGPKDAISFVCELRRDGDATALSRVRCASPYTVKLPTPGDYTVLVWSVDAAGNLAASAGSAPYTRLSLVPAPPAPQGPTQGTDPTPTWTITVPRGYLVTCLLSMPNGGALESVCGGVATARVTSTALVAMVQRAALKVTSGLSATTTISYTADLRNRPSGTYGLRAQLTDSLGNDGPFGPRASYAYGKVTVRPPIVAGPPPSGVAGPRPAVGSGTGPVRRLAASIGAVQRPIVSPIKPSGRGRTLPGALRPQAGLITDEVPKAIAKTVGEVISKPTIPLLLLVIVVGFLLLQNQIDRRDPKLAAAPVGAEPELDFGPTYRGPEPHRPLGGGAPA